jgi:hypothetical protein
MSVVTSHRSRLPDSSNLCAQSISLLMAQLAIAGPLTQLMKGCGEMKLARNRS